MWRRLAQKMKVTDLLKGVDMEKYRRRLSHVVHPKINQLQALALEIHVRETLRKQGRLGGVDVDTEFLDHINWNLSYEENLAKMDQMLDGYYEWWWLKTSWR